MNNWAGALVAAIAGLVIARGSMTGTDAYAAFLRGGERGLKAAVSLLPALCGMLLMLGVMNASGLTEMVTRLLAPLAELLHLPQEVVPMILLRPMTGSGSLAAMEEIFLQCGVDSRAGRLASVLMGSSETIFYTTSVYLGATDLRRLPWAIPVSLTAYAVGITVAAALV